MSEPASNHHACMNSLVQRAVRWTSRRARRMFWGRGWRGRGLSNSRRHGTLEGRNTIVIGLGPSERGRIDANAAKAMVSRTGLWETGHIELQH